MQKSLSKDMTSGSPMGILIKFALPMLIGNIFQQVYNMVDSIVVGKFVGSDALAAVGATGSLLFLINGIAFGLTAGISIVISQYYGAKDYDKVRKAFATATYIIIGVALIMGAIGFFTSKWLLELLGTPDSIINDSEIYMKISFAGVLGMALYNGISGVLRALGDSITPLIFLIVASVANVVLDLVFVVYFQWDVPGVAIATIISQFISAIGCIIYAYAKVKILRMPLKEFVPEKDIFKKCIKLGFPVAIQNALISISMSALQGVVNSYNEVVIAANTVASRIEQLVLQPGSSVGMALAAYAGQNIGAGLTERVIKGFKSALIIIVGFSLLMLPTMYFGGEYIMRLFTKPEDYEVVKTGIIAIRITSFFYPFVGIIFITRNFLSGVGDIKIPLLMGISEVIFRISFVYLFTAWVGFTGIWWATAINWALTATVGIYRVYSGKWKDKAIVG